MYRHRVAITNRHLCQGDFLKRIEELARLNLGAIILREKDLSPQEYKLLAKKVIDICKCYDTPLFLHSFIDVALELQHPNIHLPLPIYIEERERCRGFEQIGISTHSLEDIRKIEHDRVSYVTYSPVFPTTCKPGVEAKGVGQLRSICRWTKIPVYALGGISEENETSCIKVGAKKVCMMSVFM